MKDEYMLIVVAEVTLTPVKTGRLAVERSSRKDLILGLTATACCGVGVGVTTHLTTQIGSPSDAEAHAMYAHLFWCVCLRT